MSRTAIQTALVACIVVLAGCSGGVPGASPDDTASPGDTVETDAPSQSAGDASTVAFYISDQENDIGDFRSLNVTITRVGFERAAEDGGGWVEREGSNRSVDLTDLQGPNATLIDEYSVPNGSYGKVFVHVGEINGTLQNGDSVNVKLPGERLQIQKGFTAENGSQVEFVFDITVHKAGNSGKYILTPVISESGTDVPIERVDEDREELIVEVLGNVTRGENATVEVTRNGSAVANATVTVNDERVGTTDADGRLTVSIPDAEEVEIEVRKGDSEGEYEVEFEESGEETESQGGDSESGEADDSEEREQAGPPEESGLTVEFLGNVTQGENATLEVTRDGTPVAGATVTVNGETAGTTDADGQLTVSIPSEGTVEVEVRKGEAEGEREIEFE